MSERQPMHPQARHYLDIIYSSDPRLDDLDQAEARRLWFTSLTYLDGSMVATSDYDHFLTMVRATEKFISGIPLETICRPLDVTPRTIVAYVDDVASRIVASQVKITNEKPIMPKIIMGGVADGPLSPI